MRHFIIIGNRSETFGNAVEEFQYFIGNESGRNPQDYFSNALGREFNTIYQNDGKQYTDYIYNFIKNR